MSLSISTAPRYVTARTGQPETPAPDDWCRNCRGRGYTAGSIYEAGWSCDCCNGTGWTGMRHAPGEARTWEGAPL